MSIVAKRSDKSFTPCPAGLHQAVCVDVVDLGIVEVTYANKTRQQHKVRVLWQIADVNPLDGKRYLIQRRYTLSLDDKASLRRDLESWRGRPFTPEELGGFDLEKLISVNCQLNVAHDTANGSTYANISAIVPVSKGMPKLALDAAYVRVKDRPTQGAAPGGPVDATEDVELDEIPF